MLTIMIPEPAPDDVTLKALESLARIVDRAHCVLPGDARFADYLQDETYLRGSAALVLAPGSREEVVAIVSELQKLRRSIPDNRHLTLTLRGGGSGLSGAAVPQSGIVLDLTRMQKILEIDEHNLVARVECGLSLAAIQDAFVDKAFTYAVDPSSAALCTLGGSIATNAAGPSSLKYGTTRQNLAALRYVTANGTVVSAGSVPVKTSMGFSLRDLLCGSEGRLGIILDADIRLTPKAEDIALVIGAFRDEAAAMALILALKKSGVRPKCIEIIDAYCLELAAFGLQGGALLMIELDGSAAELTADLETLMNLDKTTDWILARDAKQRNALWAKRKSITGELKKRYTFKLGEDIAVPLSALAHTTAFAREKAAERGILSAIWGHAGDGNLHVNYLLERAEGLPVLDILMQELAHEVTRVGGAISGEHGLGRLKRKFARAVLAPAYFEAERQIKNAFDPAHIFNPALELNV